MWYDPTKSRTQRLAELNDFFREVAVTLQLDPDAVTITVLPEETPLLANYASNSVLRKALYALSNPAATETDYDKIEEKLREARRCALADAGEKQR